jgi:hypothetical protein
LACFAFVLQDSPGPRVDRVVVVPVIIMAKVRNPDAWPQPPGNARVRTRKQGFIDMLEM